jgi:hypothetical protein
MNNLAERSDWSKLRVPATDEVTKNVRNVEAMFAWLEWRSGIDMM